MTLLIAGVVLWTIAHLLPAIAPEVRNNLASRFGEGPYKALFAFDIILALALIVFGWKSATPTALYAPPMYGSSIPSTALLLAVLLMVASSMPNNLRRYVRHPQMTAVLFWSASHLLTNGDSRSLVLFGGLGMWAILEIVFINKRDGEKPKPDSVPLLKDVITAGVSVLIFAALLNFHASLFGVSPIPV
jgi:uncharacterized membrane protein